MRFSPGQKPIVSTRELSLTVEKYSGNSEDDEYHEDNDIVHHHTHDPADHTREYAHGRGRAVLRVTCGVAALVGRGVPAGVVTGETWGSINRANMPRCETLPRDGPRVCIKGGGLAADSKCLTSGRTISPYNPSPTCRGGSGPGVIRRGERSRRQVRSRSRCRRPTLTREGLPEDRREV